MYMIKPILAVLIILSSIIANGQTIKTAHFSSTSDTTGAWCRIDTAHALTMEAWVKNDDTTSGAQHEIFSYWVTDSTVSKTETIDCYLNNYTLTFLIYRNFPFVTSIGTTHLINSDWHHIAITIDQSNNRTIMFIDGVKVDSATGTHIAVPGTPLINALYIGNHNGTNIFNGNIDNVRITPNVLYTANFTDTCYYTGSYIYAALNDIDSTHIMVNSVAVTSPVPLLSNTSPCAGSVSLMVDAQNNNANQYEIEKSVTISPNPTINNITLSSIMPITTIIVSNLLGQKVFTGSYNDNKVVINLEQMPQGIYLLKINNKKVYKVIKQ